MLLLLFRNPADGTRVVYYNRCVPLPLGLVDISIRLASGFYRQLGALRHDVQLLAANARLFNDAQAPIIAVADGAPPCMGNPADTPDNRKATASAATCLS